MTEADPPLPTDPYGRSKREAELALAETGLDWAALRPVLVYGPGAKGNLEALLHLARSPYPLPLGGLRGRRSLISLESLSAAVDTLLRAPGPLRASFIAADPDPLTRPGLLPVPEGLVGLACRLTGRGELFERVAVGLVARADGLTRLGWQPAMPTRDGLARLARG